MARYLLIDFGSTFTKLTAVDTTTGDIIGTSASATTVSTDIREGYHQALADLYASMDRVVTFDKIVACSSAAGGLKMAAIGLVDELTVEAAKRVCLGAGAKVDLVFSHHLTNREIQEIINKKIDIILLAGGADGGNSECVIYNAKKLGEAHISVPIVFAGNKSAEDDVRSVFETYNLDGCVCDNVMPRINILNIESAKKKIREIFLKKIIAAKGIKKIEQEIDRVVLPTPEAVLQASELLSRGYMHEKGFGDIVVVDIGGATTDMYSMCQATNRSDVILHGLEEPFAKRTVEGDLGMRYSAPGIVKNLSKEEIRLIDEEKGIDIEREVSYRFDNVWSLPQSEHDERVDELLAEMCAYRAMHRHVGKIEEVFTPMGTVYNQTGKDLTEIEYVIGTGGVIINARDKMVILNKTTNIFPETNELRPKHPNFLIDERYILAAMGLLAQIDPLLALKIMKKHLKPIDKEGQ